MRFPVYACGYNWLRSNLVSAKRLAERIDKVIKDNNSKSSTCDQVILITHSMGGLVARACTELLGAQGKTPVSCRCYASHRYPPLPSISACAQEPKDQQAS